MNLVDTHAHLYWESYKEDFDEMVQRTINTGVAIVINVGVDVEKSEAAVQVSKKLALSGVEGYSTIGIHPHEALRYAQGKLEEDIEKLEKIYLSDKSKVIGIGECGLDYLEVNEQTKELQKQLFQAQIDLAKKLHLPLIVHCRDDRSKNPQNNECWNEVLGMVGDHQTILHCYSGLFSTTEKVLKTPNLTVSFAANITYPKNEYLREAAKILPLDRILLETDSPFLAPQSKRGQRNEPSSVLEIAQLIAELKGISVEEVANQTTQNAQKVFKVAFFQGKT